MTQSLLWLALLAPAHPMPPPLVWFALLAPTILSVNVSIPRGPPSNASPIASDLTSFSLEQDRWTDWSGTTSRNEFLFNTLDNLKILTGVPPRIRIGADSEDHTNFNQGLKTPQATFPTPNSVVPYPEASKIVVGDAYYATARFLPPGTVVTWGVNFGGNNLTAAFLEAKSIAKAFSSSDIKDLGITLEAIEIGNEADFYGGNGQRPSPYNIAQYVPDWTNFATNISAAVGISKNSTTGFWSIAFAFSSHSIGGFSPQGAFSNGLLNSTAGAAIRTVSQHHYSGNYCSGNGGLLQDLMTKSTIRSNLSTFSPDIAVVKAKKLDYVLGETNSYACHGAPGVSNTAGAALWTLDYLLYAAQIGISRVFFHEGVGYKYNLIQPVTLTRSPIDGTNLPTPLRPHVQPPYYGAIVAAEAIGLSGITRISELSINDSRIAGYAFYEGTRLVRAVFINSLAHLKGQISRSSTHLNLSFTGNGTEPAHMVIKRLAIGYADDTSGLKWGGQSYETADARPSGSVVTEPADVSEGIDIKATEVVLVTFL